MLEKNLFSSPEPKAHNVSLYRIASLCRRHCQYIHNFRVEYLLESSRPV